ncbi:MAG: chemotaxis response regulator protein-glutamate methylesterase [Fimbriimonadia bacterium]|jgi:two-component system chemotaxis response regulator CheB
MPIRVLVVDASAFMRRLITNFLQSDPAIRVAGEAADGREALEVIPRLQPDVITLDVAMPELDGIETLRRIMSSRPRPVVMLSSQTMEGAAPIIRALELGAVDFVAKPPQGGAQAMAAMRTELIEKVVAAARVDAAGLRSLADRSFVVPRADLSQGSPALGRDEQVIVIGASTGGPKALTHVFGALPHGFRPAILVVQHMPPGFPELLAVRLSGIGSVHVRIAADGDRVTPGEALLAPGGFHMRVSADGSVVLTDEPPVQSVRPAVDITMQSAAQVFGDRVVGVVLTGMGRDGTAGLQAIQAQGGFTLAEAEESCVVFGMPKSAIEAACVDCVVPLDSIVPTILQMNRSLHRCA